MEEVDRNKDDDGNDEKGGKEKSFNFMASAAFETASLICSIAFSVSMPISKSSQSPVSCKIEGKVQRERREKERVREREIERKKDEERKEREGG